MRNFILFFLVLESLSVSTRAQNLSGQWTGGFVSASGIIGGETEYVLELDVKGDVVEGHSYTYFRINGKRCYVICKLSGVYDRGSKSISVTEVAKVKSNTPPDFRDCLQTHMLTFFKQGDKELLRGRWKSASERDQCGTGGTELERKALVKITPQQNAPDSEIVAKEPAPKPKPTSPATTNKPTTGTTRKATVPPTASAKKPATTGTKPTTAKPKPQTKSTVKQPPVATVKQKKDTVQTLQKPTNTEKEIGSEQAPVVKSKISTGGSKLEARNKNIIKTIEVPEAEFTVNLYDNGQIDGDTVTLYFNGKLLVSKQRLSTNPISLKIKLNPGIDDNDLVMIAENLGSIPPNTALMVVTVGDKRFEVNITSTEQINGTVRFKLKE